jgi:hypothetical protein
MFFFLSGNLSLRVKIFCKRLLYKIIGNCLVLPYMNQGIVYMINPEVVISKQISYCRLYEYLGIELVDSFRIQSFQ